MGVLLTPIIGVILQIWVAVLKKKEEELWVVVEIVIDVKGNLVGYLS
jgi:hypothetical protein